MTDLKLDRRALLAGAAMAGALASTPALAKKKRPFVINGLGGLGDPNGGEFGEKEIAAHFLFPRPIEDARRAGLAAVNVTVGHVFGVGDAFAETVRDVAWWGEAIRIRTDALSLIRTADDIRAAHKAKRAGVNLGFQNSEMFGGDASRAAIFADLGVRVCQMTYNMKGAAGDGALVPENGGLTDALRHLP